MAVTLSEPKSEKPAGALAQIPFLSYGFRPFFLLASGYGALVMVLWIAVLLGWIALPLAMPGVSWHAHEMLFGFAGAGLAGFLLTAVPSWTGRPPAAGLILLVLAGLWLCGRLGMTLGGELWPVSVAVLDVSFFAVLLAVVANQVIGADNRRNFPVLVAVGLVTIANALSHAGRFGAAIDWVDLGHRLAMHVFILLIALIGGRIVPAFTETWLKRTGRPQRPVPFDRFDIAVLIVALAAAAADTLRPGEPVAGLLLLAAGGLHLLRLGRWQGYRTLSEPIVWVLHLGYLWLAVGSALLGVSALTEQLPRAAAVHALTVGSIGTMLVAVMGRASLGHSGRPLVAGPTTVAVYVLVSVAAVARVTASWWDEVWTASLMVSGAAWIAAMGAFFIVHLPAWTGPRADAAKSQG